MTGTALGVDFEKLFKSIDAMDMESFLGFLAADGTFRFGSAPPVKGHAAIRAAVGGFFESIAALKHELKRLVVDGTAVITEGQVTYTRHDGSTITLPFADVFEVDGELISQYLIYIDIGPLYAQ